MSATGALEIRPARPADRTGVLALLALALRKGKDDPRAEAFLDWKHRQNVFGASPEWVALDGERVIGFRTFMRWEFEHRGDVVPAVRAVDTATHPDFEGRGIFRALTMTAVEELRAGGVRFVFNTPNEQSRPGYLKMGWEQVGRLPTGLIPRSPSALPRIASARVPAEIWSEPCSAGVPALQALADGAAVDRLLASVPRRPGLRTRRSVEYLRWRYGFEPLHYRAWPAGRTIEEGLVLFRTRCRGEALEMSVAEVLLPARRQVWPVVHRALRACRADYALGLRCCASSGLVPLPKQGPVLTWRALGETRAPALSAWRLTLGDIELF